MAEENARPARGRKKTTETSAKKAAPKPKAAKPAATKAKAKTTVKARKPVAIAPEPTREAIAQHAYLLWERGEPGDETTHWLRAESELRAA